MLEVRLVFDLVTVVNSLGGERMEAGVSNERVGMFALSRVSRSSDLATDYTQLCRRCCCLRGTPAPSVAPAARGKQKQQAGTRWGGGGVCVCDVFFHDAT